MTVLVFILPFALVNQGIAQELKIIEIPRTARKKATEMRDLSHALAFTSPRRSMRLEYADCADADLVVITAGVQNRRNSFLSVGKR